MARIITLGEFEEALGDQFPRFLVGNFDESTQHVRDYFNMLGRPYDSMLGSTMVRRQMRWRLEDARGVQFEEHRHGFYIDRPYNIGLWFEFEGMTFRAYKVKVDGTPMPGGSENRVRFFDNKEPLQRTITSKEWLLNAAILWSLDKQGELVQLRVVVPSGFDEGGQLSFALEHPLPTNLAEMNKSADSQFAPTGEDDELLVRREEETVDPAVSANIPDEVDEE